MSLSRLACISFALPLMLGALVSACDDSDSTAAPAPAASTPPPVVDGPDAAPKPEPIAFATCPLETGGKDTRAECAEVEVPLDWSDPEGRKLKYFVKRLVGTSSGPHRQLWLLAGGPGGAGNDFESGALTLAKRDPSLDVYMPDHRGTGRSAFLDCPTAKAQTTGDFDYAACAAEAAKDWGGPAGLAMFSTTAAARDVGHVIERTRAPGQEVHVYGVSYGTYLAQRYLQLFPTQPTAVTLDSVCQAGICSYAKIGYWTDQVAKKYMAACADDTFCAAKLGPDPIAKVKAAITKADAGTCSGISQLGGPTLQYIFSYLIKSVELRVLIPSTTFRILRCNADDVLALQAFQTSIAKLFNQGFSGFAPEAEQLYSDVLGFNIGFSEMEQTPMLTTAQMATLMSESVFTSWSPKSLAAYEAWPRYARDEWVGKYPSSSVPILLMNGTLDPQTPLEFAEQIAPHYTQPAQTFVVFPRSAHGVVRQSVTTTPGETCGMNVWGQFLAAPSKALDTSCLTKLLPLAFEGSPTIAQYFYGRPSLWAPPTPGTGVVLAPNETAAIETELRRAIRDARPWLPSRLSPAAHL